MKPTQILAELAKLNTALATAEAVQEGAALAAHEHPDDKPTQAALDSANKNVDSLNKRIATLRGALIAARKQEAEAKKKNRADTARAHLQAALKECRTVRPAIGKKLSVVVDDILVLLRDYEASTERCRDHARNVVRLCAVDHASHMSAYAGIQDMVIGRSGSVNHAAVSALKNIVCLADAGMGFGTAITVNAEGSDVPLDVAIAVDGDRISNDLQRLVETAEDRDAQPDEEQAAA